MPQLTPITNSQSLILSQNSPDSVNPDWFEADYWLQNDQVVGRSFGRNTTYFFKHRTQEYVLRHYYRGGLVGRILHDAYFFTGLKNTRVWREFDLLERMQKMSLPVPQPIAARVTRKLWYYTADIIIARLPNARDLLDWLKEGPLTAQQWQNIGQTLAKFHQHGIFHADLNIHNIMLSSEQQVSLIDFDRGRQLTPAKNWQQANIKRLHQSFEKEKKKFPQLHWQTSDWQLMLTAYMAAQQS